jgi:hypothetical protein
MSSAFSRAAVGPWLSCQRRRIRTTSSVDGSPPPPLPRAAAEPHVAVVRRDTRDADAEPPRDAGALAPPQELAEVVAREAEGVVEVARVVQAARGGDGDAERILLG